jgi:L-cysteine:1D-myo-inositol 2-amino-2-deoxy-alpha-D-glucopyranoside ligase
MYQPPAPAGIVHPTLRLFDSYGKKKIALDDKRVSMYVCGITPYDATHLGHAATYIAFDLIHRFILASGIPTWFIENVTDIDDPLLERAKRDARDWKELAHSQIDLFTGDMSALRVLPPQRFKGVVESMSDIVSLVSKHIASGATYDINGDIYLDLRHVERAFRSLPIPMEDAITIFKERGGDPERDGKRHPLDPLLWRAARQGEPSWPAPFGTGRPGWHVECVAIALENLGSTFHSQNSSITIQGGGSDLIFPHHYMTAMQAESLTQQSFAKKYVHAGMIGLDGEKMSKSRGNLVFVSQLIRDGVNPMAIRTALILNHYQQDRMWSVEMLHDAEILIADVLECLSRTDVAPTKKVIQDIVDALADNLDTPKVFALLRHWCQETKKGVTGGSPGEMSRALDTYLGLAL